MDPERRVASPTTSTSPSPARARASRSSEPCSTCDPGRGEDDSVDVGGDGVGHLGVERLPLARRASRKLRLVPRERAVARPSRASTPCRPRRRAGRSNACSRSACRIDGVSTAPPPSASTAGGGRCRARRRVACASSSGTPARRAARRAPGSSAAGTRSISRSRSTKRRPSRAADLARRASVLPAPMKPTSATCRSSGVRHVGCAPGTRARRRRSPRARRRRTSRAPRARARTRPRPRRRPRAPRPRRRRCARRAPRRARPSARSTDRSGRISVGSGFIAARTTISSPFETPASIPPARFVSR